MKPIAIRSLGGAWPSRPSAEAGISRGAATRRAGRQKLPAGQGRHMIGSSFPRMFIEFLQSKLRVGQVWPARRSAFQAVPHAPQVV